MADHERDAAQKARFIFLSVTALVVMLLLASFMIAGRARSERDAAQKELEACKQDSAKLTQFLDEQAMEMDKLKKQLTAAQAKTKSAKGKTGSKSGSTKKKTSRNK